MANNLIYFKTDRNGTKYYYDYTCPRCGGAGGAEQWAYTGYTCYACGGSGRREKPQIVKEYTPEYQEILDERNRRRAAEKQAKLEEDMRNNIDKYNKQAFQQMGFNSNGEIYVFLGDTYAQKEEIKSKGGKFDYFLGWHIDHELGGFAFLQFTADDLLEKNVYGGFEPRYKDDLTRTDIETLKKNALRELEGTPDSEWYGDVGQKIGIDVKYVDSFSYETHYTYRGETHIIYKFENELGQIFIWDTQSFNEKLANANRGDVLHITGTIKDHSEYQGEKQTVLTRVKVG
jgi:hypothetical protein